MGASDRVVEWLQTGVPVVPVGDRATAVAAVDCWGQRRGRRRCPDGAWLRKEVQRLAASGAIEEVVKRPDVVAPIFLVPKAGPKRWRLVHDLRGLNRVLPQRAGKQEGLSTLLRLAGRGWWACSWDLEAGYHHLDVRASDRGLLGFQVGRRWFQWRVLPFGLSISPWVFTRVMREVVAAWRRRGLRVWSYIDDFCLVASSREQLLQHRREIELDLERLGLVRAPQKGHWEPTQQLTILGHTVDLAAGRVSPTAEKAAAIAASCRRMAAATAPVRVRDVASIAGKLGALSAGWMQARLVARPLVSLVASVLPAHASQLWTWTVDGPDEDERRLLGRAVRAAYRSKIMITSEASAALQEAATTLTDLANVWRPAWTLPGIVDLFTDASLAGWGAVTGSVTVAGKWLEEDPAGRINLLELLAVDRALQQPAVQTAIRGRTVRLRLDSVVAAATLRHGSGFRLHQQVAGQVWHRLAALHVVISGVSWIPSASNPADGPSRLFLHQRVVQPLPWRGDELDEWGLTGSAFHRLQQQFGVFTVDAFASPAAHWCARFWTAREDALAQTWTGEHLLLVPPLRHIHRALQLLGSHSATGVILVPEWPAQAWWPQLLEVAVSWRRVERDDIRMVQGYAEICVQPASRIWAVLVDGSRATATAWA
jgi:hypothetical protein